MRQGVLCRRVGRKLKFGDKRDYIVYTELKVCKIYEYSKQVLCTRAVQVGS